jgi:hypothetical protein
VSSSIPLKKAKMVLTGDVKHASTSVTVKYQKASSVAPLASKISHAPQNTFMLITSNPTDCVVSARNVEAKSPGVHLMSNPEKILMSGIAYTG